MKDHFESIVVGAGIIGLSCGYYLAKKGRKVLVIDKSEFGAGSSGACDDMILLQSKKPGVTLELSIESLEMYKGLEKELGFDIGFKQMGGMILIENQRDLDVMEEFIGQQKKSGLNVGIIDRKEMFRRQPNINRKFIASTYSTDDSQVYPMMAMKGFTLAGQKLGMEVVYRDGIAKAEKNSDSSWKLTSESGTVYNCDNVVVASGAWSGVVGKLFGIDIPVKPKKGQLLITEKIPMLGETNLWTAEYVVSKLKPGLAAKKPEKNVPDSLGLGFSFTRTSHGNYLIGSTRENVGFDKSATFEAMNILSRQVSEIIPLIQNSHIIRHIAGFRPAVDDGEILLGPWPGVDNVFIAAGHEGDGIALAPVTGKLLSDYVCGSRIDRDISRLSPERLTNGR